MQIWDLIIFSHLGLAVVVQWWEQQSVLQNVAGKALYFPWSWPVACFPSPTWGFTWGSGYNFEALHLGPR